MRYLKSLFLRASILGLSLVPSAHAFDLSGVGVLTLSNFNVSAPATSSLGVSVGLGALGAMSLTPFFSLESGVLFLKRSSTMASGNSSIDVSNQVMEIPLMLRFSPLGLISLSGGVYYGLTTASSLTYVSPPSANTSVDGPKTTDYGLIVGAGVRLPLAPFMKLRGDVFYEHGMVNWGSVPGISQYTRNIDILAGVMLDIW